MVTNLKMETEVRNNFTIELDRGFDIGNKRLRQEQNPQYFVCDFPFENELLQLYSWGSYGPMQT